MNVAGNFTHTAGTITETNTANGHIIFNGDGSPQTLISGGTGIVSEVINFTVNNGVFLQMAEAGAFLGGAGTFALAPGGTLGIRSEDGITSSGATGNVRVSGSRAFNTAANYVYNGTTAQSTGNGLPASCARLTVDNELDVALTNAVTINNQLILTDGHLALGNSNLTISPSASIIGASIDSYIRTNGTGILKRTVSTTPVQFPVGNSRYNPATLNRSTGSGVYNVKVRDAVLTGGMSGAPISDKVVNRSWDVTADGPVGTLTLTLQWNGADEGSGFSGLDCYVAHFNGVKWEGDVSGVASGIGPFTRSRSGITSLSPFAIGSLGVLPIELLYFKAEKEDDKTALLTWATATELNNDYMAVERSGDGQVWKEIGRVSGAGTTTVPQAYSLPDADPLPGLNYYRLRQVDYDGVFEYFNTVALNFPHVNVSPLTFDLFPNPAGDYITLRRSQDAASDGELFLMDMKGRLLQRRALPAGVLQEELDLSGLPTGMYLVRLTAGGQQEVMRFVKE
ncbi:MAG: T9SS type A sorting domain-containing protein [Saprospiraceae bacterium]|nr:T9SS type A sorting domain-containing protein [Saprospiraceae bacterium]